MKDYRVRIAIRNNRILQRMDELGFESQAALARAAGIYQTWLCSIITMRKAPLGPRGWSEPAQRLAATLKCDVEDLFNERQQVAGFEKTTTETVADEHEIISLTGSESLMIEGPANEIERRQMAAAALRALSPRERKLVSALYGLDGGGTTTVTEMAEDIGVGKARANQLHHRALGKMRKRLDALMDEARVAEARVA